MDSSNGPRTVAPLPGRTALRFGSFELHPGRQLLHNGAALPLGRIALDLLSSLVAARGGLITKEELFDAAWSRVVVVENALHQHMRGLRKALGEDAGLIVTVARRGYRFTGPVEEIVVQDVEEPAAEAPALPMPLTPLIGRDDAMQAIEELLDTRRCVTLLGAGGVGKTRLALEVAHHWVDRFAPAVHWVELAALADGEGVAGAVATAFGLGGPSSQRPLARVARVLRATGALLVLDNCEHVVEGCAAVAHELLRGCPGLKVLATSQRPLGLAGEQRLRVPMLGLPPAGTSDPGLLAASPAVRLLLARVGECDPLLRLEGEALPDAAELCRQLDGNALAIELAAPRVAALGLVATRTALAEHFRLLAGGPCDVQPQHRSLQATIDWSHALLTPEQAAVYRRLAVFAGGWTVDAAIAVAGAGDADGIGVASRLAELVDRSLILADGSTQSPRFRMLETQRFHALDKLRASGEYETFAAAHARHFADRFEASFDEWDGTPDQRWMAVYGPERDNLRAAIRLAEARADATLAARLVGSSLWLWRAIGAMHELRQLMQRPLLGPTAPRPAACQARLALALAYSLHTTSSESCSVQSAAAQAVEAFEEVPDMLGAANALLCLASAFAQFGHTASHEACLGRVDALLRDHRHGKTYGWYCGSHAWAAQLAGDLPSAQAWAIRSCAAYRDSGAWHGETRAMLHLADLRLAAGDVTQAVAVGQSCVDRLQGGLHRDDLGRALGNLGAAWFARDEPQQAQVCWTRALEALRGLDFSYWIYDHIALLATTQGRDEQAAQMLGYAEAGYTRLGKGRRVQNEQRARDRALALLRSRHTPQQLATWMAAGADASEQGMATLAVAPAVPVVPRRSRSPVSHRHGSLRGHRP